MTQKASPSIQLLARVPSDAAVPSSPPGLSIPASPTSGGSKGEPRLHRPQPLQPIQPTTPKANHSQHAHFRQLTAPSLSPSTPTGLKSSQRRMLPNSQSSAAGLQGAIANELEQSGLSILPGEALVGVAASPPATSSPFIESDEESAFKEFHTVRQSTLEPTEMLKLENPTCYVRPSAPSPVYDPSHQSESIASSPHRLSTDESMSGAGSPTNFQRVYVLSSGSPRGRDMSLSPTARSVSPARSRASRDGLDRVQISNKLCSSMVDPDDDQTMEEEDVNEKIRNWNIGRTTSQSSSADKRSDFASPKTGPQRQRRGSLATSLTPSNSCGNLQRSDQSEGSDEAFAPVFVNALKPENQNFMLEKMLKNQYMSSVLGPAGKLDKEILAEHRRIAKEGSIHMFYTDNPLLTALSRRWFRVILLLLACGPLISAIRGIITTGTNSPKRYFHTFRFTPLEWRDRTVLNSRGSKADNSSDRNEDVLQEFGVLIDTCDPWIMPERMYTEESATIRQYPSPVEFNGIWIRTSATSDPDRDPVRFVIEARNNNSGWEVVGGSYHRFDGLGRLRISDQHSKTVMERNEIQKYDYRPSWMWHLAYPASQLVAGIGMVASVVLGEYANEVAGEYTYRAMWFVSGCMRLAACFGAASYGDDKEAWWFLVYSSFSFLLFGVSYTTRSFMKLVAFIGVYICAATIIFEKQVFHEIETISSNLPYFGFSLVVLASVFMVIRLRQLQLAQKRIRSDRRILDGTWEMILQDPSVPDQLLGLKAVVAQTSVNNNKPARHFNAVGLENPNEVVSSIFFNIHPARVAPEPDSATLDESPKQTPKIISGDENGEGQNYDVGFARSGTGFSISSQEAHLMRREVNHHSPVASLGQLYTQANAVHILLVNKVQAWAYLTEGYVKLHRSDHEDGPSRPCYSLWREVANDVEEQAKVQWTATKPVRRAMEKVIKCYSGDVSRLVDVARQRIVFDNIVDLTACLRTIMQDESVMILRIKNFMDDSFDGNRTAGFRAVVINLRICTADALQMGIDTHVVEVMLTLKAIARNMDSISGHHARYLKFRDDTLHDKYFESTLSALAAMPLRVWRRRDSRRRLSIEVEGSPELVVSTESWNPQGSANTAAEWKDRVDHVLDTGMKELMKHTFVQTACMASGYLSKELQNTRNAIQHAHAWSVAFTSQATSAVATKKRWRRVFFLLGLAWFVEFVITVIHASEGLGHKASQVRFTSLQTRDGSQVTSQDFSRIHSFGISVDGCQLLGVNGTVSKEGPTYTIKYDRSFDISGFWIRTADCCTEMDPSIFTIESRLGPSDDWKIVASSSWRVHSLGVSWLRGEFSLPRERQKLVHISAKLGWAWVLVHPFTQALRVGTCFSLLEVGRRSGKILGQHVVASGFGIGALLHLLGAFGFYLEDDSTEGVYWLLVSLSSFAMCGVVAFRERHFVRSLIFCGSYLLLLEIVHDVAVLQSARTLLASPPVSAIVMICFSLMTLCLYEYMLVRSKRLMEKDKEQYDRIWEDIISSKSNQESLLYLAAEVSACELPDNDHPLQKCTPEAKRRHSELLNLDQLYQHGSNSSDKLMRRRSSRSDTGSFGGFMKKASSARKGLMAEAFGAKRTNSEKLNSPKKSWRNQAQVVECLDQLFAQARGVNILLIGKAQEWSWESHAMVLTTSDSGVKTYMPFREVRDDFSLSKRVQWAKVKKTKRAIEKLTRSYNGEVAKLVDVARQSMVFENIDALCACLRIIREDPEVKVLRAKNRLSIDYDSTTSMGYRDLCLNLKIQTKLARYHHLENHVCELQLLLLEYAKNKNEEGHQRYKTFRDARGE